MQRDADEEEEKRAEINLESLSFAKQLFFGKLDQSRLFPFPRPTLEEKERTDIFCHKLRLFSETHIDPIAVDRQAKIPDEVIQGLAKLGMLGLTIPQKYGGLGMSLTAFCKALEVISQRCTSTTAFLTAHQSIGYKAILLYGTPEQKQRWLPPIAGGEIIAAFALTEPDAGSDVNNIKTKAVYNHEKKVFYLTGKKQWVTNGAAAKVLTVMAKTEINTPSGRQQRITAFIVTPNMPGFKVTESALDKVGMRGVQTSNLEFTNMEVPLENVLGKPGEGLKIALSVLNYGRITIGASCTGPAKLLVDYAFKYAHERHQFQRSLSSFSLVKGKLARLAALAYAIDAVTYFTAGRVDAGEKDFMIEAAIVKVFSTEALWWMIFETMQIFGGKAIFTDSPYELMLRDCLPSMITEGSNDVMRMFISITGIKDVDQSFNEYLQALKSPFLSKEKIGSGFKHLLDLFLPKQIEIFSPWLQKEAKMLASTVTKFGRAVMQLVLRYGDHFIDKQIDLERVASAVIGIYTTAAVLSMIDSDLERVHGKMEIEREVETAKFFCCYALKNARRQLDDLFNPLDSSAEHLSDSLIEGL